ALVITDYHMPGMHGVQLIQALRKLPQTRFTPMLVLTTESQQEKRDEARKAGATGWLVKPVQADKLLQVVRQVAPALQARAA
ncbi:MAG: response regulator, partial [Parafilimonas terrae]|nr:response regulator [Parafilimonas terrae]